MNAIVIHGPKDLRYEEVAEQTLGAGQVRVRIEAGGVCGSDLHYYHRGGFGAVRLRHPMVLGHEVAGRIIETGVDAGSLQSGDRVAINPSVACGVCDFCRAGLRNHCTDMRFYGSAMRMPHVDGAFRETLVCQTSQAYPIPDAMTFSEAAFAEPFAVCLHAAARSGPLGGKKALIIGAGPIGMILALVVRDAGAGWVAVADLIDAPLRRIADLGADETVNVSKQADRLARYAEHKGTFDVVFEASGSAEGSVSALAVVKPRGVVVAVGQGARPEIDMSTIVTKEINVVGAFRFDEEFKLAIDYIARHRAQAQALLTATLPASDPTRAFDLASDKTRSVKVHLKF
jgi:L-idonate 5-dehydrogenase